MCACYFNMECDIHHSGKTVCAYKMHREREPNTTAFTPWERTLNNTIPLQYVCEGHCLRDRCYCTVRTSHSLNVATHSLNVATHTLNVATHTLNVTSHSLNQT